MALATHCGGRAGSPLYAALCDYFADPVPGRLRAVARRHGVIESTLRKSVRSFRTKMGRTFGVEPQAPTGPRAKALARSNA